MNLVQSGWTKIIKKKLLSLDIKEKKIIYINLKANILCFYFMSIILIKRKKKKKIIIINVSISCCKFCLNRESACG